MRRAKRLGGLLISAVLLLPEVGCTIVIFDQAPQDPGAVVCGDAIADPGEQCDDGNTTSGDGCSARCGIEVCGNGVVDPGEDCDSSGVSPTCDADCTFAQCGDGLTNQAAGEQCDTGGASSATCNGAICTLPLCGDGFANTAAGEQCDTAGESATCDLDCTFAQCGDGLYNPAAGEQCDDGNQINGDGCESNCTLTP